MNRERSYYVYMMQSASRRVLYTGVTGGLRRRVFEHKRQLIPGFTAENNCTRLVFYERFSNVQSAIVREKEIKGWTRAKKEKLIVEMNPKWADLAEEWY